MPDIAGWIDRLDPADRELVGVAREAAGRAAEVHASHADRLRTESWEEKGPSDFVTGVDREAERRIVECLRERFPADRILAEEGGASGGSGGADGSEQPGGEDSAGAAAGGSRPPVRWIIDPLDGTTNWLHDYPEYAVSIAGADARGLRVGVVRNTAAGEEFLAVRGAGSLRDGTPIRVSRISELRLALVGTGFPFKKLDSLPGYLRRFSRVLGATSGIRRGGSAALDLCDLACGRLDAFFEHWLMPWDVAAGALIVREAGGTFAPLEAGAAPPGHPLTGDLGDGQLGGGAYFGCNEALLAEFAELLAG